jgi:hypothetical protein
VLNRCWEPYAKNILAPTTTIQTSAYGRPAREETLPTGSCETCRKAAAKTPRGQSGGDAGAPAAGLMPGGDRVKTPCNRQFSDI